MKLVRILAMVVGGLVLLVALALVAVLVFVDPNDYRADIESRVAAATGRTLKIDGKLELSVFPWIAVNVGRVTLGNAPGFGAAPFLQADAVRVGAKLLPLLRGRLEARRIAVDGLQVNLATRADGTTNWQDLTNRPGSTSSGTGGGPGEISIAGLDVTHAALTITNERDGTTTRVREFELHSGALRPGAETNLDVRGMVDAGDATASTSFDVRTRATLDLARSAVALRDFAVEGERRGAPGPASGAAPAASSAASGTAAAPTPVRYRVGAPSIDYTWSTGTLAPASLDVRWGELPLRVTAQAERLTGDRLVAGRIEVPDFAPRAVAAPLGVTLPATRDAQAFSKASFRADFRLTSTALQFTKLQATLDRSRLEGTAAIDDLERMAFGFDLRIDALDVDAYRAPLPAGGAAPAAPAGPSPKAAPTPLPFDLLRTLAVDGRLAIAKLSVAGLALSDVQLPIRARDGVVSLAPRAAFYGGRLGGAGLTLDARRSPAILDAAFDANAIDVGALVKTLAKSERLSGRANGTVRLRGTGATDTALVDSLAGPIAFDVQKGAIEGVDLVYELQRASALFRREAAPARSGAERTPFDTLTGTSQLERGVLTTDPLRVETALMSLTGHGTFRIADQAVNYALTTTVREAPRGGADGAALADLRSITVPLTVTGTLQDYKVRPDVGGLAKARVKQEVDKRRDEVTQKAKDKLRDKLDKLLGR